MASWRADDAALAADGSVVVFASEADDLLGDDGSTWGEAYLWTRATGTTTRIARPTATGGHVQAVDVSGDGDRLVLLIGPDWSEEDQSMRLVTQNLRTGATLATRRIPTSAFGAEISEDGSTVAWIEDDADGTPRLLLAPATTLAPAHARDDWGNGQPSLDRTGEHVLYRDGDGRLVIATGAGASVEVPTPDGTTVRNARLSSDGSTAVYDDAAYDEGNDAAAVWSTRLPDGVPTLVAGSEPAEGEEPTESPLGHRAVWPAVSADGSTIALWLDQGVQAAVRTSGEADTTAPTWPAGAKLTAEPHTDDAVRLRWPEASDDVLLRGYELTADGRPLVNLGPARTSYDVPVRRNDPTPVQYAVRAADAAGNLSAALETTARGAAVLTVDRDGVDALRLDWAGSDRADVTGYRVLRADGGGRVDGSVGDPADLTEIARTTKDEAHLVDEGLRLLRWYDYRVDLVLADGSTAPWTAVASEHTELPGPGPLTIDEVRSGSARLTWAPAPSTMPLQHFVVERQQQSPDREYDWTEVGTRTPDQSAVLVDADLKPRSTYLWRVRAVLDLGWPTRDWTEHALGSTAGEGLTDWDIEAERTADGAALVLGTELVATAAGEPGMGAEVRLWEQSKPAEGEAPAVTLPLAEVAAGRYRSAGYVLDGTALKAVGKAEVVLFEGERRFSRSGTVGPISGRLDLDIAESAEELPPVELVLRGPKGTQRQPATAGSSPSVPLSPGRWDLSLAAADGDVLATRLGIDVAAATPQDLTVTPERHAELAVTVTGSPLLLRKVVVRNAAGTVLATRPVNPGTGTVTIPGLPRRTEVTVQARLDDQAQQVSQPTETVRLGVGRQELTLTSEALPTSRVRALVTGSGGPLADAAVAVTQKVDGRDWRFTGRTDATGRVTVDALSGDANVRATAERFLASGAEVRLVAGETADVELDLVPAPTYLIRPQVFTTNAGGQPTPQPMDWSTNYHLHVDLTANGRPLKAAPAVAYAGNEGETVKLCADGFERGLSATCASVKLGTESEVPLRIDLTQAGLATGRLVDTAGAAVTGSTATVYKVESTGMRHLATVYSYSANPLVGIALPGVYQVVFAAGAGTSSPMQFSVSGGSVVDLGTVRLAGGSPTGRGATFDALPDPVLPGGRLTYRVSIPGTAWPNRTALKVTVPSGTTPSNDGVVVDGKPVGATRSGNELTIPVSGSGATVIRYSVDVAADVPAGRLSSIVRLVHDNGATTSELGSVAGTVAGVTVSGPRIVTEPEVRLNGTAPPGATVSLAVDGGAEVRSATAGPGGRWTVSVPLAHSQRGSRHEVLASVEHAGQRLVSTPFPVRFDPTFVQPDRVVIDNIGVTAAGSRSIAFDPSEGVAAFTMVYIPSHPIRVRAEFADASRIHDFVAHVGSTQAAGTCDATSCTAEVRPATSADVGDIWVDYDSDALPRASIEEVTAPSEEELRHNTREPFNDPRPLEPAASNQLRFALGATGVDVTATVGGAADVEYTTTPADERMLARTGVPAYGMGITGEQTADGIELRLKAAVPRDFIAGGAGARTLGLSKKQVDLIELAFKLKAGAQIGVDQLKHLFDAGDEEEEFVRMEDYIRTQIEPCSPDIARELYNDVRFSRATVIYYRLTSDALNALGLLGGSWTTMAEGLVKTLVETLIGELMDMGIGNMISDEVDSTKKRVYNKPRCDKRIKWIPPEFKFPKATPTWIFDPSGYVYEALGANRIEGVKATVLAGASEQGPWTEWDAAAFGQSNPQRTTADGRYGWDVTPGWWKVRYEKDGYRTTESEAMEVLPERYDVNIDLHRTARPALASASLANGAAEVAFDTWMSVDSVSAGLRVESGGTRVAGTVQPVAAETSPRGVALAKTFRFVPTKAFTPGQRLRLTVASGTLDHGRVDLGADAVRELTVPGTPPPAEPGWCSATTLTLSATQVRKGQPVTARVSTRKLALVGFYARTAPAMSYRLVGYGFTWFGGTASFTLRPSATTSVYARPFGCKSASEPRTVTVR
ncbi:hypothetical protein EFK50_11470 [Nocardioides marmoriginsengisoli]|uniref:Fibronectin type-III domain-containing protein n=1 Tax=Nocardioides marmoriginsengisoli TaxID=661483 RepID=A0A3N0CG11_9ACTN|nr:hypothetical protein EFK50_11470 [Nocardioides marmoriginsengisoli]